MKTLVGLILIFLLVLGVFLILGEEGVTLTRAGGRTTAEDAERGCRIQFPDSWDVVDEAELKQGEVLRVISKEDRIARVTVLTTYIVKRPNGVRTLEDWMKLNAKSVEAQGFESQSITSFDSRNETGIRYRYTARVHPAFSEFVVSDQYIFMNFLNDENDRRLWMMLSNLGQATTTEKTRREMQEIVDSFDVLRYEW